MTFIIMEWDDSAIVRDCSGQKVGSGALIINNAKQDLNSAESALADLRQAFPGTTYFIVDDIKDSPAPGAFVGSCADLCNVNFQDSKRVCWWIPPPPEIIEPEPTPEPLPDPTPEPLPDPTPEPIICEAQPGMVKVACNDPMAIFQDNCGDCWATAPDPAPLPPINTEIVRISYSISGDEIDIFANITNTNSSTKEYRIFVYNSSGNLLDKEPDLSWKNIRSSQSATLKVSSKFDARWDINSVFPLFRVRIFEQNVGYITGRIIDLRDGSITSESEDDLSSTIPENAPPIIVDGRIINGGTGEGGTPFVPPTKNGGDGGFLGGGLGDALKGAIFAMIAIGIIGALKK